MEQTNIKLYEANGNAVDYKILFTFECEELGKNYIAFTKDEYDELGKKIVYIAYYDPEKELNELEPVKDEEELKMAEDVLNEIINAK